MHRLFRDPNVLTQPPLSLFPTPHHPPSDSIGRVWRFGNFDSLASATPDRETPTLVTLLSSQFIVSVSAGAVLSVALDASGGVWTFGDGIFGDGEAAGYRETAVRVDLPVSINFIHAGVSYVHVIGE